MFFLKKKISALIDNLRYVISRLFLVLLFCYFLILLIEQKYPNFYRSIINIDFFLILVLIFCFLTLLLSVFLKRNSDNRFIKRKGLFILFLFTLEVSFLIYKQSLNLGFIQSLIIASSGGVLFFLLSLLLFI